MLNLFFKCLLFCSGVLSFNASLALPLENSLNTPSTFVKYVSSAKTVNNPPLVQQQTNSAIGTINGVVEQAEIIFDLAINIEKFTPDFYHLISSVTYAKAQKTLTNRFYIHFVSSNKVAKTVEDSLRRKYLLVNPILIDVLLLT